MVSRTQLVLLPGMDGTGVLFQPLLDVLPPFVVPHVHRYPQDELLSYEALAAGVLASLPRDSDFVIVAESFSGPIALRVAASRPPGLRAVVLCASFAVAPVRVPSWLIGAVRPGLIRASPFALQAPVMLGVGAPAALRALLGTALAAVSPAVLASRARDVLQVDETSTLAALGVPLLYLRATRDRLVSPRSRDHVLRHCPGALALDIDGPHLLLQARPVECWRAIDAFIQQSV